MEIKYIDIHSHLSFGDYNQDLKEVIKRMEESGVATITVGTDLESSKEAVKIADEFENIWACIGIHPTEHGESIFEDPGQIKSQFDGARKDFEDLVKNPKVVAIGECGLDYFKLTGDIEAEKTRQKKEFIKQIEFAIKHNKPLMLHLRHSVDGMDDVYDDAFNILESYIVNRESVLRGNLHFFAGSLEWAKKFIGLGFTISFTGVVTFTRQYDEIIKNIPLDKIHAETDSPFVAPIPYRGKRNEPTYMIEVAKKIAEIRGEDFEKVRIQLLKNARKVFNVNI